MIEKAFLWLLLTSGIGISFISAYFSVIGFTVLFKAIFIPIALLASLLELSKLLISVWLKLYIKRASWLMTSYLIFAMIVLMMINGLGVYSYLSKGYLDTFNASEISDNVKNSDELIQIKKEQLQNMNDSIRDLKNDRDKTDQQLRYADKEDIHMLKYRKSELQKKIDSLLQKKEKLHEELLGLKTGAASENRKLSKLETELGPIKYMALLIYSSEEKDVIDRSMRLFIIILITVFDPLAIVTVIAAVGRLRKRTVKKESFNIHNESINEHTMSEEVQKTYETSEHIEPKQMTEETWKTDEEKKTVSEEIISETDTHFPLKESVMTDGKDKTEEAVLNEEVPIESVKYSSNGGVTVMNTTSDPLTRLYSGEIK